MERMFVYSVRALDEREQRSVRDRRVDGGLRIYLFQRVVNLVVILRL